MLAEVREILVTEALTVVEITEPVPAVGAAGALIYEGMETL